MNEGRIIDLSIILPAYNEGPAVVEAIQAYAACLPHWGIQAEVVVVNDGSVDDTGRRADEAARRYPWVRVLHNPVNRGQVASILRGFAESHGLVATHNGIDLPFAPQDTRRVLECLAEGADLVVVERADRQAYGWARKLISWCNIALVKVLLRSPFQDHNFVQAYHRRVLEAIRVESAGVSTVTAELIVKAVRLGFAARSLRADYHARRLGRSTITVRKVLRTFGELLRLYRILRVWRNENEGDVSWNSEPRGKTGPPRPLQPNGSG